MANVSFVGLLIVALVAFLAPLLLGLSPVRRLPAVVIEIVAGIVIGPSVLGWVSIDLPISILSLIGLAFLLFLAGMEVELERLRGRLLLYVGLDFVASMALALLVGSTSRSRNVHSHARWSYNSRHMPARRGWPLNSPRSR